MLRQMIGKIAPAAMVWLAVAIIGAVHAVPAAADNTRWGAGYFPNVPLTTQDGVAVRFYDDVVKGKIVAINLIYTTCKYACPLETARLAQVARLLGDRMGRDVFFYSITIDPDHDTPAVLKEYAAKYQAGPGWTFLTGKSQDIELISRKLGLYSEPNPSNPDGHTPMLILGNEATGQWMRNSALDNPKFLSRTIGDWLNSYQTTQKAAKSYADVPAFTFDPGEYIFRNHCGACHTIGHGDQLGPDLAGVTAKRDHEWLARFIIAPDKVIAAGDPIARSLLAKYQQVLMPNLALVAEDADLLIGYMETQSRAVANATAADGRTAAAATTVNGDLTPILDPYLRIQRALNGDGLTGVEDGGRAIAIEAAKLGANGAEIRAAAEAIRQAADLTAARTAFARLGDAIMILARSSGIGVGADVKVAYCPMVRKYWLQKGDTVQNPFYGKQMSDCGHFTADIPSLNK